MGSARLFASVSPWPAPTPPALERARLPKPPYAAARPKPTARHGRTHRGGFSANFCSRGGSPTYCTALPRVGDGECAAPPPRLPMIQPEIRPVKYGPPPPIVRRPAEHGTCHLDSDGRGSPLWGIRNGDSEMLA
jgi:hypothetical protein